MTLRAQRLARYREARERIAPRASLKAFELLVAEALDDLPAYVHERLENVAIVVEQRARPERLERMGYDASQDLLGLYEGINKLHHAGQANGPWRESGPLAGRGDPRKSEG